MRLTSLLLVPAGFLVSLLVVLDDTLVLIATCTFPSLYDSLVVTVAVLIELLVWLLVVPFVFLAWSLGNGGQADGLPTPSSSSPL